jgi:hypothetical protein
MSILITLQKHSSIKNSDGSHVLAGRDPREPSIGAHSTCALREWTSLRNEGKSQRAAKARYFEHDHLRTDPGKVQPLPRRMPMSPRHAPTFSPPPYQPVLETADNASSDKLLKCGVAMNSLIRGRDAGLITSRLPPSQSRQSDARTRQLLMREATMGWR